MLLQGKRVLFFSFQLFGYQYEIKTELERCGAKVDYFDERPANTFWVKALIRINRNLLARYINNYHNRILESTKGNLYDYIFFIKGEAVSKQILKRLREFHPQAQFIIYHWDSIANNPHAIQLLPFFDKIYSFDKVDCNNLGINFLPLFYLDEYVPINDDYSEIKYDLLFIGTVHSDRYRLVLDIVNQLTFLGYKSFVYFYFPSRVLYYKMKLLTKNLKGTSIHDFYFKPLKKKEVLELYKKSRVIVDIQHPKQTGLTMRCVETLGAGRKLITTNSCIIDYDFYCPGNILVVDRKEPIVSCEFLNVPYKRISEDIYNKYSLHTWINTIFQ